MAKNNPPEHREILAKNRYGKQVLQIQSHSKNHPAKTVGPRILGFNNFMRARGDALDEISPCLSHFKVPYRVTEILFGKKTI